ncbi:MAG: Viral domain, partial [Actinomycetota bacterium]|nr:Viral domain [Actinomycetota bacterium]
DPVLLAYLGPGECEVLADILEERGLWQRPPTPSDDDTGNISLEPSGGPDGGDAAVSVAAAEHEPPTTGELLAAGPDVAAHVAECAMCADRQRAMVSTRALVAQVPLPTPPASVVLEARRARRRLPASPPPSVDGGPRRVPRVAVAVALVIAVLAVSTAAGARVLSQRRTRAHRDQRINALTKVPGAGSALTLSPASVKPTDATITLTNSRATPLSWKAVADVPWIDLSPSTGRIDQAGSVVIGVKLLPSSPEGNVHATITVTGNDGSAAATEVVGMVERPPQVSAVIAQCKVTAATNEPASVVELHWRGPTGPDVAAPMAPVGPTYVASIPDTPAPLTWWVQATDADGNPNRTPDRVLEPGRCAPVP